MRRLILGLLFLVPLSAFGQVEMRSADEWSSIRRDDDGGCIGGSNCRDRRLRVPLADRPVIAVRFHAHDQVGNKAEGVLRVKIDGNTVRDYLDIPRRGETFTIEVDEMRGRQLVFEAVNDDEIMISDIAVQYGRGQRRPPDRGPREPIGMNGGWRQYPAAEGCIGGNDCKRNGDRITVALADAAVIGVRFYAHDSIGQRADGRVRVRIDDEIIDPYIDVQRAGKRHDIEVDNLHGTRLVIETINDDEVEIKNVEVLYARGGRGGGGPRGPRGGGREVTHEGSCIGGSQCGGNRARIRIAINGRAVNNIRFYARDDIGTRAGGELRIRIDDEILEYALDIPREGRTFTVDGKGIEGDYVIIETAEDDEVDVKDVRVRFEEN